MAHSDNSADPLAGADAGSRAAGEPAPELRKAQPIKLLQSDSAEDAAVCVFSATLDHFEANAATFRERQSVESVHQMRVALRRLRAAIGLFKDALCGPSLDAAREKARSLAAVLGQARNWDVFRKMLDAPGAALAEEPSYYALIDAVELRRAKGYRAVRAALEGDEAAAFVRSFREAIAARDWTAAPNYKEEGSAKDFARAALSRLRKRVLKKSKGLAARTPEERHELRIALKKARYGAEFFESLFAHRKDAADFAAALAKMQDGLGAYNDMATANALLVEVDAQGGATLRASGFVRGWFAHAAQAGVAHARKSEKRLKKLQPFWE
ncbi:MAG: hypothetical protein CTY15_05785 [Methylocystis sp.]|nr:MAG: hypothetical protein CTY15_05785 [Methylocystis sp.]